MPTTVRNLVLIVVLAAICVLSAIALGGIITMSSSLRATQQSATILRYNAVRGDCIREITANADQQFRRDITDLLEAGRDPAKFAAVRARMRTHVATNYADTAKRICPPALPDGARP